MAKLSFIKWFPNDWLRDTRKLSHLAKAVWIDICNIAWNEPERGIYERSMDQFCIEMSLKQMDVINVMTELATVGSVTVSDKKVTVECRRMTREERAYKLHANRQSMYRARRKSDAPVTIKTLDVKTLDVPPNTKVSSPHVVTPASAPASPKGPTPTRAKLREPDWEEGAKHFGEFKRKLKEGLL